ncbi:UNVERIFIED_CONTAM: hypothetical protein PYX00_005100 [Menopon gallinae]|uniref:PH domain-containing protein n=1 Tax=Menopon gallinae TaxID=328185 RepID=A0AAW2HRG9_9NEOP
MAQEEEICTKISDGVKMAGFLEKKGKMKIVSAWKKYWFVLEERLLLYYRSQIEYINLSPCRGSLNLGLVTTIRPGSSSGPYIIHVITRTQVVQLRAKNRATQEEWLQALLDSMSLPLFSKTLKTPLIADLHGHRYSMDNIPSHERLRKTESERRDRHRQGFEYRKKDISDSFYGGSLDNAIWSKRFRTVRSPSPNIPKGKMLEKILGYVEEADTKSASDMVSLIDDDLSGSLRFSKNKYITKDASVDDRGEEKISESENGDNYGAINRERMSLSDNQLNRTGLLMNDDDKLKARSREESQFERIKNAMKKTRGRAFKNKSDLERKTSNVKKRRHSFLQKVFKRNYRTENEKEVPEYGSDTDDPLYDTIENIHEQKESLISSTSESSQEQKIINPGEETAENAEDVTEEPGTSHTTYTEVQRPIFGSKSILSAQAMSELKIKLKSREGLDNQSLEARSFQASKKSESVPDLPPRIKCSRPRSPWHDVPMNNTPVDAAEPKFNIQQATVKFHDDMPVFFRDEPEMIVSAPKTQPEGKPEDDLNILLEQLTEITSNSLRKSLQLKETTEEDMQENSWERSRLERRFSDPDYDIPRPHKLANLCISYSDNIDVLQKQENSSDTSSSFQSIEPDSLESDEKKNKKTD